MSPKRVKKGVKKLFPTLVAWILGVGRLRGAPVSGKVSGPPTHGVKIRPRPLTSAHLLTTIAITGLNGDRVGVEVGGEGVGMSDVVGMGGRGLGVGGSVGRSVGRLVGGREGGVGHYVPTK